MPHAELAPYVDQTGRVHGDRIWLTTIPREHAAVKLVPGARWDTGTGRWRVRLAWTTCVQLRAIFGETLEIGPQLLNWAWKRHGEARVLRWLGHQLELPPQWQLLTHGERLYPPQVPGATFLLLARGAILADEMGGGKTPTTCVALREVLDEYPGRRALVVAAKASVQHVWLPHIREWVGEEPAVALGNVSARRRAIESEARIVLTSYDNLLTHTRLARYGSTAQKLCPECGGPTTPKPVPVARCEAHAKELNAVDWLVVVADEAHKIKDPSAKRARALKAVMWPARYRWLLTGTPMANHEGDYWSLLNAAQRDEWPSRTEYIDRYCLTGWNPWGGLTLIGLRADTAAEFHALTDTVMIRRPRRVLMPWLPEALPPRYRYVELPRALRRTYNDMRDELLAEIEGGLVLAPNPLTNTIRLRQLACANLEQTEAGYQMVEPSPKLDELEVVLEELGDEPVVVFAEFVQLLQLAEARLTKVGISWSAFHGSRSDAMNDHDLERWTMGKTRVLLMSLAKGSESLTLTRARVIVYLQDPYSILLKKQSRDRIDRDGQTRAPLHVHIVSEDTIEARVIEALKDKGERFERLVRDRERLKELL